MSVGRPIRVLLVAPNRETSPDPVPPMGIAMIAGALRADCIEVRALDFLVEEDPEAAIARDLADFDPHVIGLSIRNIDTTAQPVTRSFLPELARTAARLRETNRPIVLGGPATSVAPAALLERLDLEFAIVGEGEAVFPQLVRALAAGDSPPPLPGLVRRDPKGIHRIAPEPIQDLDALPPADHDALDLRHYGTRGGVVGIQTKRGCAFRCLYCVYPAIEGRINRCRSPSAVADEMASLHDRFGIDQFFIVDSVFNEPASHALEMARAIGQLDRPLRYSAYLAPRQVSPELAEAMVSSGCLGVEFGTDSLSPAVLQSLGKGHSVQDVVRTAEVCRGAGLSQCHHLIFGAPGETLETVRETIARAEEIAPDALIGMTGVRILPGTDLARQLFPDGADERDLLEPRHHVSPAVADVLDDLLLDHVASHPGWVLPGLGHNCDPVLFDRIRGTGYRGPTWALLRRMSIS